MPEMQKPVLEHAAPKADQNQRLGGRLADSSLPESTHVVNLVTEPITDEFPPLSWRFGKERRWHPRPTCFLYAIKKDGVWMWATDVVFRDEEILVIRYQKQTPHPTRTRDYSRTEGKGSGQATEPAVTRGRDKRQERE